MGLKNILPIDPVVNIIVNRSTISAPRKAFDVCCLIGDCTGVDDFDDARVIMYDSVDSMLQAGFAAGSRLVSAAQLLMGQAKTPKQFMVGKIDDVDIAGSNTYTITVNAADEDTLVFNGVTLTAGADFEAGVSLQETAANIAEALNDNGTIGAIYNAAADGAVITVTEKVPAGGNTPGAMTTTGTLAITAGTATVSTTRQETPLEAFTACRQADTEWYVGIYCADITDAQIIEVANYTESCTPNTMYAYTTASADAKSADEGIFNTLKSLNYRRTIGQYSTSHPDAIAAVIGWAMGAMGAATMNSAYTIAYKAETGVQAENYLQTFTTNTVNNIKANNGNVYINRGEYYNVFEEGKMADGSWFDEIIYLDKFQNDMQLGIMDLLVANNKIPQTEAGMSRIKNEVKVVCDDMNRIGFIAEGTWKGADMMKLHYGDTLPGGYLIQSEPISEQSQANRDARIAPPIYVSLKLAGAIHHVTVQIDVNR